MYVLYVPISPMQKIYLFLYEANKNSPILVQYPTCFFPVENVFRELELLPFFFSRKSFFQVLFSDPFFSDPSPNPLTFEAFAPFPFSASPANRSAVNTRVRTNDKRGLLVYKVSYTLGMVGARLMTDEVFFLDKTFKYLN